MTESDLFPFLLSLIRFRRNRSMGGREKFKHHLVRGKAQQSFCLIGPKTITWKRTLSTYVLLSYFKSVSSAAAEKKANLFLSVLGEGLPSLWTLVEDVGFLLSVNANQNLFTGCRKEV